MPFFYLLTNYRSLHFKWTVPRDFRLLVFFNESVSPKPLSISLGSFRVFFENSQWYSQLKVHRRCRWHRWQIFHWYQQHQLYHWQNLPPVSLIPVANLPPVSLTPVMHFDLKISPRIFEKIRKDPNAIFRGLGEGDKWKKNLKQKISWHCPFKRDLLSPPWFYSYDATFGLNQIVIYINCIVRTLFSVWSSW